MPSTPKLNLAQLASNFTSGEIPFNEMLVAFDVFTGLNIIDRGLTAPPGSETDGDAYIVATGGTGTFAGQDGKIAYYFSGYRFITPWEGLTLRIVDEDLLLMYDGAGWREIKTGQTSRQAVVRLESPADADQVPLLYTTVAVTISSLRTVLIGTGTPSTTWNVKHATDRSAAGTNVFTANQTTTSETTGDVDLSGFNDETIPAGRFVWVEIEGAPTTTDTIEWYVNFNEDAV